MSNRVRREIKGRKQASESPVLINPARHLHFFIFSVLCSVEMRRLRGLTPSAHSRKLKSEGAPDEKLRSASPFYRFEGVQTPYGWSISDSQDAWPDIDRLRAAMREFDAELARYGSVHRGLRRRIEALQETIATTD